MKKEAKNHEKNINKSITNIDVKKSVSGPPGRRPAMPGDARGKFGGVPFNRFTIQIRYILMIHIQEYTSE